MSTTPHNWLPEPHQLPVLMAPQRFKVIVWHRKAHKTTLAINELIRRANAIQGTYWYVAPFYGEAKDTIWLDPQMLPKYCPPEIWDKRNNSELYIPFPNGSVLFLKGADKPDSLRGPNPRGVVLDEYGTMKSEVWQAIIQPIMTANPKAWTWFVGTPKGKNDLWIKLQQAKDNDNWFHSVLPASKSGILSQAALDEARKTTPQAFYAQEYECEFSENAGAFFRRVRSNLYDGYDSPYEGHEYQLGVDLAKYQDYTVITPFDLNNFRVHKQDRFNQIDWNLQKSRIEAAAWRYGNARVKIDRTGVGDPIVEDLTRSGLSIGPDDAIAFTENTRTNLLNHLAMMLEQDKIKLPNDEGLIAELESFQYVLTPQGKLKIAAPESLHDDRVMSLALAVNGATDPLGEPSRTRGEEDFSLYGSNMH